MPGSEMSRTTTSGRSVATAASADGPSVTAPTTSHTDDRIAPTRSSIVSQSSTRRTRGAWSAVTGGGSRSSVGGAQLYAARRLALVGIRQHTLVELGIFRVTLRTANAGASAPQPVRYRVFALTAALWLWAAPAGAQTTAVLLGRVVDESGAAIPAAVVAVRGDAAGFKASAVADPGGRYRIGAIPAGTYTV